MSRTQRFATIGAVLAVAASAGCSSSDSDDDSGSGQQSCATTITSAKASPVTGYVTLTGNFYEDETVRMNFQGPGGAVTTLTGTPASDRTVLDIGPWPAGTDTFFFQVSCTRNGQAVIDSDYANLTVDVP